MSISPELQKRIEQCRVLVVGAGGIGCEVLKNLTLSGFTNIDAVDLDTIDVSNLNRQFLFNKTNVGQSKAEVAVAIAKTDYSVSQNNVNMNAIHKSIMLSEFDVDFFRSYSFVINALDNRAARSHVNRMCLSAEIPLLESGTAGYTGQSKLIKNSLTACYECDGIQKEGRTYATCTIRNTPSQPIHCIVWAKHLFHQLFGEDDPDNDVSPQFNSDNEKSIENGKTSHTNGLHNSQSTPITNGNSTIGGDVSGPSENSNSEIPMDTNNESTKDMKKEQLPKRPKSTRDWAIENNYDPVLLFQKLYSDDINYLLTMHNLWKDRAKPTPLNYVDLISDHNNEVPQSSKSMITEDSKLVNQRLWSMKECVQIFSDCVTELHKRMQTNGYQHWDKDDEVALRFVVTASNLRSKCFNIERKSPFDVKSLAGNIVPAISSTNSIIGGLLVLQAIRLLKSMPIGEEYRKMEDPKRNELLKNVGRLSYLNYTSLTRKDLIASYEVPTPLDTCLACAKGKTPEIEIHLNMNETTLSDLVDKIIIGTFHFVCPDLALNDDSGTIIWSKDDDDEGCDPVKRKMLTELPHIKTPKTRLLISDLLQDKEIILLLVDEKLDEETHKNFFYAKMNGTQLSV